MESHVEVYNCETYTGKASIAKVMYESFKPSEINSHGSVAGFAVMGFMQMRNYFYHYPPTGTCSMKAVLHRTQENAAEAIEIKLKMDSAVPAGKKAAPGKTFSNVKGAITLLGTPERKWNVQVSGGRQDCPFGQPDPQRSQPRSLRQRQDRLGRSPRRHLRDAIYRRALRSARSLLRLG